MRKSIFKAIACGAALVAMTAMVIVAGNTGASAEDGYLCNYTFEDGNAGDFLSNGVTGEIVGDYNSNAGAEYGETVEGSNCLKVTNRAKGNDWWERNGIAFDLTKFTPGVTYDVSVDIHHECDAVMNNDGTEKYGELRAFKIAIYFPNGKDGEDQNAMYNQIGSLKGAQKGDWERISGTFKVKDDEATAKGGKLIIAMMYPEVAGEGSSVSYKDKNTEDYYIDNFIIKEHVDATATPEPTAEVTPTPAPVVPDAPVVVVDESLEVGYEEVVGPINYVVNGEFTVAVVGFDNPKSKINIPATIKLEDMTYKVTEIKAKAFVSETDVKTLTIGANVKKIGKQAFKGCSALKTITVKSTAIKSIGSQAFKGTAKKITVKCPKAKKAAYKKMFKKAGVSSKAKYK